MIPFAPPVGGAGEDAVDVGFGRVRDPDLRAGQAEAAARSRLACSARFAASEPGLGLAEREGGDGLAAREPRDPLVAQRRLPAAEDRVAAEALQRERRLGLGAAVREALAELAELDRGARRRRSSSRPCSPSARTSGRFSRPGSPLRGDRREDLVAEAARAVEDVSHRGRRRPSARRALRARREPTRRSAPSPGSAGRSAGARPRPARASTRGTPRCPSCRRRARRAGRARRRRRAAR